MAILRSVDSITVTRTFSSRDKGYISRRTRTTSRLTSLIAVPASACGSSPSSQVAISSRCPRLNSLLGWESDTAVAPLPAMLRVAVVIYDFLRSGSYTYGIDRWLSHPPLPAYAAPCASTRPALLRFSLFLRIFCCSSLDRTYLRLRLVLPSHDMSVIPCCRDRSCCSAGVR